jgi:hypothetical protein
MHHKYDTVRAIFFVLLLSNRAAVLGQDASDGELSIETPPPTVEVTDPRIAKLRTQYRRQVDELSAQLIAKVQKLGSIDSPPQLQFVKQNQGKWAIRGSLSGFANHSIGINARDIEESPSWSHLLENPPLGSRRALAIADETMRKWFRDEETKFALQRLALVPLSPSDGKWYWEAEYEVSRGRSKKELNVAIRMDGKVLTKVKSAE